MTPADAPAEEAPIAEAPPEEPAPADTSSTDQVTDDPPAASARPLFNPSVDEPPQGDVQPTDDATADLSADLPPVDAPPVESVPAEARPVDAPIDAVPVAEAPPVLFPTDPPFIQLPSVRLPSSASRGPIAPRVFVADILEEIPTPNASVRMNPDTGLVAVPTWFWVEGYDGRAFGVSRRIDIPAAIGEDVPTDEVPRDDPRRRPSSMTIAVTVRPSRYEWTFGDGTRIVTSSLGKPYPQTSDVKHAYEFSSLRSSNGFAVGLTIEFTAEYRINGGAAQALPPIRRTYQSSYRVQEIQPVLTSR